MAHNANPVQTQSIVIPKYVPGLSELQIRCVKLTLSLPNEFVVCYIFLVCFNFQNASMSLKVSKNVNRVSNILDPGETPRYSASQPDPSCLYLIRHLRCAWWAKG